MIKKTVLLAISVVMAVCACMFGFQREAVSYGRGGGEDTQIVTHEALAKLLQSVPSSAALLNGEGQSGGAVREYASFSMGELGKIETVKGSSTRTGNTDTENTTEYVLDRYLEAYYTSDAAYYHGVGSLTDASETKVSEVTAEGEKLKSQQVNSTTQTFDWEIYISAGELYVKYNKYELTGESYTVTVGEDGPIREDIPFDENDTALQIQKIIQDNYGRWINLTVEEITMDGIENAESMSEADQEELMIAMLVSQLAQGLRDSLIQQNDTNMDTLASLGEMLGQVESDSFELQSAGLYRLTEEAALAYFTSLGFVNQHAGEGRAPGSFVVSYLNPTQPAVYENVSVSNYTGSSNSSSRSERLSLTSNLSFFNVNNTVVSFDGGNALSARDFFEPMVEMLIQDMTGGNE